jgi:hypothetical protein
MTAPQPTQPTAAQATAAQATAAGHVRLASNGHVALLTWTGRRSSTRSRQLSDLPVLGAVVADAGVACAVRVTRSASRTGPRWCRGATLHSGRTFSRPRWAEMRDRELCKVSGRGWCDSGEHAPGSERRLFRTATRHGLRRHLTDPRNGPQPGAAAAGGGLCRRLRFGLGSGCLRVSRSVWLGAAGKGDFVAEAAEAAEAAELADVAADLAGYVALRPSHPAHSSRHNRTCVARRHENVRAGRPQGPSPIKPIEQRP